MNRWLRLALTTVISAAVVVTGVFGAGVPLPPAVANTASPAIVVAAKNSSITVGADAAGALHWSTDSGTTWTASGTKVGDHPVTSIIWNGSVFIASSYFSAARSSDGRTWSRFLLPVGSAFDPGNLISDAEFFTSGTMSVDQIQAFLNDKVSECRSGYVCMKDYRETTFTRDATVLCNAYEAGENETAAQIIFKVAAACGVSAEAMLVLIQKEMGLVTHTWPSTWRFQKATGYACPDTAPCDERFFGFYNQVYNAARQFKRYSNPPGTSRFFTWFPVGQTSQVRLHPNAACGPDLIPNPGTVVRLDDLVAIGGLAVWVEQVQEDRERAAAREESQAEQELLSSFREGLDSACLEDLRTWEPATQNLGSSESSRGSERVESRGEIIDGAGIRKNVTCDYNYDSLAEPNFSMNQIVVSSADGAESATYRPGAEPDRISVEVSSECSAAMRSAAQVPLSRDNNSEVIATGDSCQTVDEWWLAVKQNPNAFGASKYPDDELWIYLATLCGVADGSAVCRDAEAQGLR